MYEVEDVEDFQEFKDKVNAIAKEHMEKGRRTTGKLPWKIIGVSNRDDRPPFLEREKKPYLLVVDRSPLNPSD